MLGKIAVGVFQQGVIGLPKLEYQAARPLHGVARVHGQIDQSAFQLYRIDHDGRHLPLYADIDDYRATHSALQQWNDVGHQLVQVDGTRLQHLFAGERQ